MAGHKQFNRMISWQLSQVIEDQLDFAKPRAKVKSKKQQQSLNVDQPLSLDTDNEDETIGYVITNSEGEEEIFYSAPESLDSEDDAIEISEVNTVAVKLPQQDVLRSKRSKKKKKKKKLMDRMSRLDFFQPLSDLIDDKVSVDVENMDLSNYSNVLSLSEICLATIKKIPLDQMEFQLPFLITSLVSSNRQLSGIVARQVQWLEKFFGEIERAALKAKKEEAKTESEKKQIQSNRLYKLMIPWQYDSRPVGVVDFATDGLHCPLPSPLDIKSCHFDDYLKDGNLLPYILYYINYFYPATLDDRSTSKVPPSPSLIQPMQRIAIDRINYWIKSRYSSISQSYSKMFNIWPAYIHWARGNLRLAVNSFASELDNFEAVDKCVILNEMARMFLHFGDRRLAISSYMKSSEVEFSLKDINVQYQPNLMCTCYKALQAGVWDIGLIDELSAYEAKSGWEWFLREASLVDEFPTEIWFLHVAAIESMLRVHAGQHVMSSTPEVHKVEQTDFKDVQIKWLEDCEKLIRSNNLLEKFPVLYYHLSLVYALQGMMEPSRRAFDSFLNNFAAFHAWGMNQLPGRLFEPPGQPNHRRTHPWQNLFNLIENNKPLRAPILPLHWRVQLLHPLQPYNCDVDFSVVADLSPVQGGLSLRFTSDGYLTGDILMYMPPMRSVLLDPYNGNFKFKRMSSLQHFFYNPESLSYNNKQDLVWPLRVYESSNCVVELSLAYKRDFEISTTCKVNYMAVLDWYGTDSSHHKVDLRRLIRKEYKKTLLEAIYNDKNNSLTSDKIEEHVNKVMELGLEMSADKIMAAKGSFSKYKSNGRRAFCEFQLNLKSFVVFGRGTLMLTFSLHVPKNGLDNEGDVIVFINCTSVESFLSPVVHCSDEKKGFYEVTPFYDMSLIYEKRHLQHMKYALAIKTVGEKLSRNDVNKYYFVFNEDGAVISQLKDNSHRSFVVGNRLFYINDANCVTSCDITNSTKSHQSYPISLPVELIVVPGLLLIRCQNGLLILHPGTLERLSIEGLRDTDGVDPPQDGFIYPQLTAIHSQVSVLYIYDISIEDSVTEVDDSTVCSEEDFLLPDDFNDYGSCRVAVSVNDRIVIIHCTPRTSKVTIDLDVSLPGRPVEFHIVPGVGYIVCASQFADSFRSNLYLLSNTGILLGVLPCLGLPPYSFYSSSLPARLSSNNEVLDDGGIHVYFHDGVGGICCIRLKDIK